MNDSNPASTSTDRASWGRALVGHLLLSGYLIASRGELERVACEPSTKTIFMSFLNAIGCVAFAALGLLGIVDGPEAVHAIFAGNLIAMSQFLNGPVTFTYIALVGFLAVVGLFLPWFFATIASITRDKASRNSLKSVFVASCYGVTTPLAFIPLVHVVMLWATWAPVQLVHLLGNLWLNVTYYGIALVAVIGLLASIACFKKVAGLSTPRALLPSLGTLGLLVILILLVVQW